MAYRQTSNPLVKKFQRLCHEHLKPQEIERLARSLKRFERSRDVAELAKTMVVILDTPEKSTNLYPVVYELIPVSFRRSYQEILQRILSQKEDIQLQKTIHENIPNFTSEDNSVLTNRVEDSNTIALEKVIHLDRSPKDGVSLGFRLCYSDACGSGFFINSLEPGFAEWSGLEIGDEFMAVNDISVHNWQMTADQLLNVVVMQRQQRAGVDILFQRLMFNPQKLTIGGSCLIQDVSWYDIADMTFHRKHKPKWPSHLRHTRMKMKDSTTGRMGLNIRGGREFSCGIYISKIEREGLAERCGLRVGDQILTVNEVSLSDVPYRVACRHMAYEDTMDFVVRYSGQFPIYINTPQNQSTSIKSKDRSFLHDTNLCGTIGKNYPYSNGRVDPIGSCSPGTIHSYKKSGPSNEDRLYTDTSFIYNPLCSDESSLLNSLRSTPSLTQTSDQASEIKVKSEINLLDTQKMNCSEVTPKPPPRTGKPNLEKLNQILSRRSEAALKPKKPSTNFQDNASSLSSKVEVETTAIVHQPAEDTPKPDPLEDGEFQNPVDQKKLKTKPPRKNKNSKMNLCDEKSKSESKNENEIITKPETQAHQEFIAEPVCIPEVKIDTEAGNIEPELIELLEHSKPESVNETVSKNIPNIVIKPENVTRPEIIILPESNNNESFPENFMKPEVILEADLLSFHRTSSPMHDDDDKLSYISSVSLEYDGDNFIMKSSLSEDETVSNNSSNSRASKESDEIGPLDSVIPDCDDIYWREKSLYSTYKLNEVQMQRNNVISKVRQIEENYRLSTTTKMKNLSRTNLETRFEPSEPISLPTEKLPEPPEVVIPSVTITPVAMTQSPSPSTMTSPHNTMDRGNYTKPKRRTEEGRFQNAVLRTMANLASSKEEDAENNPFQMLQKMATVILTKDEIKSIMQYVAEYMERNDVEHLVSRLLGVLNKPEKQLLLNQIRELVSPFDRGRFDSMLSVHENINFQKSDYRERFNEKGERGRRPGLKEEQSLLARVQCRRKQLDAQLELLENLRKIKPKIYKHKEEDLNLITVYVSKNIRTLGISVTGGADCKKQQAIVIEEVHSGGAAAETKRIKPGMILVSVDDEDIEAASHKAAVYTIRKAFTDRKKPYMKLVLRKPADVERWSTS